MIPLDPSRPSGIHALAASFLQPPEFILPPWIAPPLLHRAASTNNRGLDHLGCEAPVAVFDCGPNDFNGFPGVVTDRRLYKAHVKFTAGSADDPDLAFDVITAAQPDIGTLVSKLRLHSGPQEARVVTSANGVRMLAGFVDSLLRVPPGARATSSRSPVAPTADDPTGALGVARALAPLLDPRVDVMLRLVFEAHRRGELPAAAGADLATRAWVFARTVFAGRGMRAGFWQSANSLHDLLRVFVGFFGAVSRQYPNGPDTVFEFVITNRNSGANAAASTAVGLAMLAVVGVGWVSVPRTQVQGYRIVIRDLGGATGFMLMTALGNQTVHLARHKREVFESIVADLMNLEALFLLGRCAFGWNPTPDQILGMPRGMLEARVRELIGPVDLSLFFALLASRR